MHLGIIMDGNRRWAKQKMLPSVFGHKAGFENTKDVVASVFKNKVEYLTLWGLSKENLEKRSSEELKSLFKLFEKLIDLLPFLIENEIRFETIGDIEKLPESCIKVLNNLKQQTSSFTKRTLVLALAYSGQDEILRAIKKLKESNFDKDLNEETFRDFLDTASFPKVDLIIRTGLEKDGTFRHSGFMLYDSAYSEYYFTKTLYPDLSKDEIKKAIDNFNKSNRRFGK